MKITQIIENIKEDVNEEESVTLSIFNRMLQATFKLLLFAGLPFLIFVLMSFAKLN